MEQEVLRVDFTQPVPLFPLPNFVLLPHATVPLHIFEPRYRVLTKESLEDQGLIALASFDGDEWLANYEGNPALRSHVCVGSIVKHERFPNGRYNLLLQGVCRARIIDELEPAQYRTAIVEATETNPPMEIDLDSHRQRIEAFLDDPLLKTLKSINAIHQWLSREMPTIAVVDLAIMTMCQDLDQRYAMLVESDAVLRAEWLERMLRSTQRMLEIADRLDSVTDEDGVHLN